MIGDAYKSAVIQAVLGAGHSDAIPSVLWGAWLDGSGDVLDVTGIIVPHDTFEAAGDGVANTSVVDAGAAPASIGDVEFFAVLDAETDGQVVVAWPVTFDPTPSEGDAITFDVAALQAVYGEP